MAHVISTGQLARLLGTSESRIAELVRRSRLYDPPEVVAGRRLWTLDQSLEAAAALQRPICALLREFGTDSSGEVAQ